MICSMQSGPRSSRLSRRTVEAGAVGADEYLLRQFLLDLFRDFIQELSFCDNMVSLKVDSYTVTHHNVCVCRIDLSITINAGCDVRIMVLKCNSVFTSNPKQSRMLHYKYTTGEKTTYYLQIIFDVRHLIIETNLWSLTYLLTIGMKKKH